MNNTVLTDPRLVLDQHLHTGIPMVFMSAYHDSDSLGGNEQSYRELKYEIRQGGFHYNQIIAKKNVDYLDKAIMFTSENTACYQYNAEDLKNEGLYLAVKYELTSFLFVDPAANAFIISAKKESLGQAVKRINHLDLTALEEYFSQICSHRFETEEIISEVTKTHSLYDALRREAPYNRLMKYRQTGFTIPKAFLTKEDKLPEEVEDKISEVLKKIKEGIAQSDLSKDLVRVSYSAYDNDQSLSQATTFFISISVNIDDYYYEYQNTQQAPTLSWLFQTILTERFGIKHTGNYVMSEDITDIYAYANAMYSIKDGWVKWEPSDECICGIPWQ